MVRKYKYISFSDRKQIAALYQTNARPADIAEKIGVITSAGKARKVPGDGRNWRRATDDAVISA